MRLNSGLVEITTHHTASVSRASESVWTLRNHLSICSVCSLCAGKPNTTSHMQTSTIYLSDSLRRITTSASPLSSCYVFLCADGESMFDFLWCLQSFFLCGSCSCFPWRMWIVRASLKWGIELELTPFRASEPLWNSDFSQRCRGCILFPCFVCIFTPHACHHFNTHYTYGNVGLVAISCDSFCRDSFNLKEQKNEILCVSLNYDA